MRDKVVSSIEGAPQQTRKPAPFINPSKLPKAQPTDKDKTLAELDLTSNQFNILFENLPQGIALHKMLCNKQGIPTDFLFLASNKTYNDMLFPSGNHLEKKPNQTNTQTKTSSVDLTTIYEKVAKTGTPEAFEAYYKSIDKWYQIYVYSPKKPFLISVFMDITKQKKKASQKRKKQKQAKKALLLAEKRYRRFFEPSHDGIMARDKEGKMIDCNNAYAKMLGYTKKELNRLTVQQLLPELWHEQRDRIVNKVLKSGRSIVFEREYIRKDGSVFPASVRSWRLIDPQGTVIGIWSIIRDITEQKNLQRNLEKQTDILEKLVAERTKQLRDAERLGAIGQTAGMVGHDLRNPLQTMLGELYIAKKDVETIQQDSVKSNLQESIRIIEEQIAYMDKIVSDLQAFVQPVKVEKTPFSLTQLIDSVLETVTIPKQITLINQIPKETPKIKADPQLLKRVLINLVTNAIQAMPEQGTLTITAQADPENKITLSVQDTGIGIPDQIKNQIFTPLFTTKPRGQGFGLAVCKRVIEAHGGTINFESQVGKGTKFTTQLPIN